MNLLLSGIVLLATVSFWTDAGAATAAQEPKRLTADILTIEGEQFVVKDGAGTQAKIHVGADTEKYGHFQPGDRIDVWVLPNGHAKTVMLVRSKSIIEEDIRQQQQQQEQRAQR